ncbi:hypothetical protein [Pseudoduganella umbonata]|uniref:Uncharacterized protein n=1 Tax=Pseudoduganella umbonata TaxID=864828 RepID=A0A4P8HS03_9BURK|nr:hypothetical protein [Pseudoduganella umbonata]MBB3220519.1 hypothetical protein [Pseudoduganella umbonata]QCP11966.1 hypothetical protein FCL38_17250 [Pseudoduganella umbonata]
MTPEQASQILEQLALGFDPGTGEPLRDGDACIAPDVIRALFIARNALRGVPETEPARRARRAPVMRNGVVLQNVGKKWSADDADTLLQQFEAGMPIGQIAAQLGRTGGSIVARLVHAGVLPDRETGYALLNGSREQPA